MRLVMMGTGTFAEPTFHALLAGPHPVVGLITQPDKHAGSERGSTRQTGEGMKTIALQHGLPVLQPVSINTPEGVEGLRGLAPDLLVVAAYGQILSKDVLQVPPLGGINVHASLLPKYRGAAPIAWAIWNGETETGVTIIRMSVALDAGTMLAQEASPIGPDETTGEVESRLSQVGARLALQVIEQLNNGTTQGIVQDKALVTKAPKLTKEMGLIDWTKPGQTIANQVRAMQPWPTAYTFWRREGQPPLRLILYRTRVESGSEGEPGTILAGKGDRLLIQAGASTQVEVLELQPAGKRRMPAGEFLRGRRPQPGDRMGPESP